MFHHNSLTSSELTMKIRICPVEQRLSESHYTWDHLTTISRLWVRFLHRLTCVLWNLIGPFHRQICIWIKLFRLTWSWWGSTCKHREWVEVVSIPPNSPDGLIDMSWSWCCLIYNCSTEFLVGNPPFISHPSSPSNNGSRLTPLWRVSKCCCCFYAPWLFLPLPSHHVNLVEKAGVEPEQCCLKAPTHEQFSGTIAVVQWNGSINQ